ncbi:MAG: hypothetical protein WCY62_05105 [Clostridia bacterium]|jgi:FSR family fosmidomycin resistance protein-like MFS transporter
MILAVYSIAHFFVDAVCAAAIFSNDELIPYILMYDLLAFSTQGITGILTDIIGKAKYVAFAGGILVAAGAILPIPVPVRVCMLGLGNSIFHVGGGAVILKGSDFKAYPLGIFVAPGSLGLVAGTLFPTGTLYFAMALAAFCIFIFILKPAIPSSDNAENSLFTGKPFMKLLIPVLILSAVSIRSIGSYAVSFPWKDTVLLTVILGVCVMLGKMAGGFILDRIKAVPLILLTVPLAGIFISFFSGNMVLSLIGQFLLNCSMPLTLYLLYRIMPEYPGFSFGLAASFLFPGMLIGKSLEISPVVMIVIFAVNAVMLLFSVNILKKGGSMI